MDSISATAHGRVQTIVSAAAAVIQASQVFTAAFRHFQQAMDDTLHWWTNQNESDDDCASSTPRQSFLLRQFWQHMEEDVLSSHVAITDALNVHVITSWNQFAHLFLGDEYARRRHKLNMRFTQYHSLALAYAMTPLANEVMLNMEAEGQDRVLGAAHDAFESARHDVVTHFRGFSSQAVESTTLAMNKKVMMQGYLFQVVSVTMARSRRWDDLLMLEPEVVVARLSSATVIRCQTATSHQPSPVYRQLRYGFQITNNNNERSTASTWQADTRQSLDKWIQALTFNHDQSNLGSTSALTNGTSRIDATDMYQVVSDPPSCLRLLSSDVSVDVPYGSYFTVQSCTTVTRANDNDDQCQVVVTVGVYFFKHTMFRRMIEQACVTEATRSFERLAQHMLAALQAGN
ncbi:hypothetical protein DYB28_007191 [Aphanomyces astaci]|uniref:VASt domain-containing protein n=1 Tax=Aphanomyces astaci TaxID=112090 RepID=A0A9X8DNA0_APHAT|nr:hypothetical protein DYB28_007191 [Aphanomyces astaci]